MEGPAQAVQCKIFNDAGVFPPDAKTLALSVGALNSLDPANALRIWQENFTSSSDIYDYNPEVKKIFEKVFSRIPQNPFHKHKSWKEQRADFKEQYHKFVSFIEFLKRARRSIPSLPLGGSPSPKDLIPFSQMFIEEIKASGLDKIQGLFDPTPFVKSLRKVVDLSGVLNGGSSLLILTRSSSGEHIFSAGATLSAEALAKIKIPMHDANSEEKIFRAAIASAALRPFFAPVQINGGLFWDVGERNPFPVEYLMDAGCDTIFAFVKNFWSFSPSPDASAWQAFLDRMEEATQDAFFRKYEKAMERAEREGRKLYTILSQPPHPDQGLLDISKDAMDYIFKVETEATKKWLADNLSVQADLNTKLP